MSTDDPMKVAKNGIALIGEVIKAAGDNPNVKQAGQELGKTALTITRTINNALLPLAAINYAFDRARKYFEEDFQRDISKKAATIPPEQIVEPKASIAGPALQGLAFSHEEVNLKEMYLNLLASSMDGRVAKTAHPAFVEIIRQLDAEEARLIRGVVQAPSGIAIVEIRLRTNSDGSWRFLLRHLLDLKNDKTKQSVEDTRLPAMVDNWVRLGLVEVDYSKHLSGADEYSWVENRPEVKRFRNMHQTETNNVLVEKGVMIRTALGEQFAKVVGLL